jgi:hypothetical protein
VVVVFSTGGSVAVAVVLAVGVAVVGVVVAVAVEVAVGDGVGVGVAVVVGVAVAVAVGVRVAVGVAEGVADAVVVVAVALAVAVVEVVVGVGLAVAVAVAVSVAVVPVAVVPVAGATVGAGVVSSTGAEALAPRTPKKSARTNPPTPTRKTIPTAPMTRTSRCSVVVRSPSPYRGSRSPSLIVVSVLRSSDQYMCVVSHQSRVATANPDLEGLLDDWTIGGVSRARTAHDVGFGVDSTTDTRSIIPAAVERVSDERSCTFRPTRTGRTRTRTETAVSGGESNGRDDRSGHCCRSRPDTRYRT